VTISRESTAERIADVLRRRITEGDLRPGTQLSEERLVARLGVSRNTLREAFRLLAHDGLLIHRRHRGVFVPELDEDDLIDLYRLRRTVECDVVRSLKGLDVDRLRPLRADVEAAESAASRGEWGEVATANMRFHQCLVSLAGSRRIDDVTRRLLAELRLVFHVVASPRVLHERYVGRKPRPDRPAGGRRGRAGRRRAGAIPPRLRGTAAGGLPRQARRRRGTRHDTDG